MVDWATVPSHAREMPRMLRLGGPARPIGAYRAGFAGTRRRPGEMAGCTTRLLLLLVVATLLAAAAMAVVILPAIIAWHSVHRRSPMAETQMEEIAQAVINFERRCGPIPLREGEAGVYRALTGSNTQHQIYLTWTGPISNGCPCDPWGGKYRLYEGQDTILIRSAGPGGQLARNLLLQGGGLLVERRLR